MKQQKQVEGAAASEAKAEAESLARLQSRTVHSISQSLNHSISQSISQSIKRLTKAKAGNEQSDIAQKKRVQSVSLPSLPRSAPPSVLAPLPSDPPLPLPLLCVNLKSPELPERTTPE